MNTSAIPNVVLASNAAASKPQPIDSTTPDEPFKKILTREVADRHEANNTHAPKPKDAASSSKKKESSSSTSPNHAEDKKSSDAVSIAETESNATAEQLLMMAAQFSPAVPPATLSTPIQNTTLASPSIAATSASLSAEAGNIISATQNAALESLGKPELVSIEQNSGAAVKADIKPAGFDAALSQVIDKNQSPDTGIKNEQSTLTGALPQQEMPAAKIAERLIPSAASQPVVDLGTDKALDTRPDLSAALAPLQQAIVSQAQIHAGHSSDRLTPQVGTPAWNQSVGQKLVWMIGSEQQSASLTLNPPDLGPLQVVLSVSSTQANASFYSSQPEVRQALEAALPKLREMLGEAGIQLGQANVSAGTPQQQGSYGEQQASSRGLSHRSDSAVLPATPVSNSTRIVRDGLIDTFA